MFQPRNLCFILNFNATLELMVMPHDGWSHQIMRTSSNASFLKIAIKNTKPCLKCQTFHEALTLWY